MKLLIWREISIRYTIIQISVGIIRQSLFETKAEALTAMVNPLQRRLVDIYLIIEVRS